MNPQAKDIRDKITSAIDQLVLPDDTKVILIVGIGDYVSGVHSFPKRRQAIAALCDYLKVLKGYKLNGEQ